MGHGDVSSSFAKDGIAMTASTGCSLAHTGRRNASQCPHGDVAAQAFSPIYPGRRWQAPRRIEGRCQL
eukprot:5753801-Pyramimonas_sp.AAC.1